MRPALNTWLIPAELTSRSQPIHSSPCGPNFFFFHPVAILRSSTVRLAMIRLAFLLVFWIESPKYHSTSFFSDFQLSFSSYYANCLKTWLQMNTENVWFADAPKRKCLTQWQYIHRKNIYIQWTKERNSCCYGAFVVRCGFMAEWTKSKCHFVVGFQLHLTQL